MLSLQTKTPKPPRILIYGCAGIGKSTFGAMADRPVFIQTEDGLDALDVPAFPLARSFTEVMGYIGELAEKEHEFKTLVIDSLDWLEPLVWAQCIAENPTTEKGKRVENIEDYGWGKGYVIALNVWREYIDALNYLRSEKGMTIIQIAHANIKRFENPDTDPYDRYQIKMQQRATDLVMEHCDMVLFANYFVATRKAETDKVKGVGSGERLLYTEERPSYIAKNRYGLPDSIPFDKEGNYWATIAQHVPFFNTQAIKED